MKGLNPSDRRDRPEGKGKGNGMGDSSCSTPYDSASSSPGRGFTGRDGGVYFSAPASPRGFPIALIPAGDNKGASCSPEFEFSSRCPSPGGGGGTASAASMSSADELFLNGQIRPMSLLASHPRQQQLEPLPDEDDGSECRRRDLLARSRSVHRRTRSMSPLRSVTLFDWTDEVIHNEVTEADTNLNHHGGEAEESTQPAGLVSASRSSSSGRYSKRWIFLKDLLYRSKSEGRERDLSHAIDKFWNTISFTNSSTKAASAKPQPTPAPSPAPPRRNSSVRQKGGAAAAPNGGSKTKRRGGPQSAHERHYAANRAQAEEMKHRTFLPYRQGLLGCIIFTSPSYGAAVDGFLNSVS